MTSSTASDLRQPKLLCGPVDWLLLLAGVGLLPGLMIFCSDFWYRTNLLFFPILMVVPLGMVIWRGRLQGTVGRARSIYGAALWLIGGVLAVAAAWHFSPWLAWSAWCLVWMAWSLLRLATIAWTRVISWALPLVAVLVLPLRDAADPFFHFVASVTGSASNLLDILGVPHMLGELALELRFGRIEVTTLCQGLGDPYLFWVLTVLLCLWTRPSWLICLVTLLSVPLWAWGGAVALLLLGSLLAEFFEIHILLGYRLWLAQAFFLFGQLLAMWLFQRGLRLLFAPFVAYSEGVGKWHRFFNAAVLWPTPDPLRKRKTRELPSSQLELERAGTLVQRRLWWGGTAVLFVIAGGLGYYQLVANRSGEGQNGWELITQSHMSPDQVERWVSQETLPADFEGMQLVAFELRPTPGTTAANAWTARWTYARREQTLQLAVALPWRGFYPRERLWLADGGTQLEERRQLEPRSLGDGTVVRLDELVLRDVLAGPSYLAYASWSDKGTAMLGRTGGGFSSIQYQPTTASLSLFVPGSTAASPEDREQYRRILMSAVAQF